MSIRRILDSSAQHSFEQAPAAVDFASWLVDIPRPPRRFAELQSGSSNELARKHTAPNRNDALFNMSPATLPPSSIKVGPFWWVDNRVVGLAVPLAQAAKTRNLYDAEQNHVDLWDELRAREASLLRFADIEYFALPRGRALYDERRSKHRMYLDASLLDPACKAAIAEFFGFAPSTGVWKTDPHYTTSTAQIDALFRD